jgi:hypothetical protein
MNKVLGAFSVAGLVMVCLVFLTPDIDYDSYFRFQLAYNMGFSFKYVHSLIWLPAYQYVIAFIKDIVLMRLFSVMCVLLSGFVLLKWRVEKEVAVATSLLFLFNPFIILYGSQAMSESLVGLLTVAFMVLFMAERHLYATLVLVCGVLTAYSLWVFVPFVLIVGLIKRRKTFAVYVLPVLAIVWWGYVNYVFANDPLNFLNLASSFYKGINTSIATEKSLIDLLSFPLIYPLTFTLPFPFMLIREKIKALSTKGLLTYFVATSTALLMVGQVLGYVFSWSRYFIPLIPAYIMLGCGGLLKSKHKKVWIIAYFVASFLMTVVQAYEIYSFKLEMLKR